MATPGDTDFLDDFTRAYLAAAHWTETGDTDQPDCDSEFSQEAIDSAKRDCDEFRSLAGSLLEEACNRYNYNMEGAGHDFWLTRNGHGSGFWDRDTLDKDGIGDKLTEIATSFGSATLHQGDDGLLYF